MDKKKELCDFCGGELHSGKKDMEFKKCGEMVLLRAMPSKICCQCGEAYLDAKTSEKVEKFLNKGKRVQPREYISVPVYTASAVLS